MIASLLNEIHKCVLLCATEEIVPTRINLYAATMEREGRGDLQTFIAYLKTKQNKLTALGTRSRKGKWWEFSSTVSPHFFTRLLSCWVVLLTRCQKLLTTPSKELENLPHNRQSPLNYHGVGPRVPTRRNVGSKTIV